VLGWVTQKMKKLRQSTPRAAIRRPTYLRPASSVSGGDDAAHAMSWLSAADVKDVEPVRRMGEQGCGLDDPHFLGAAGRGALQHGEDGRGGVAQRIRRVRSSNARGHEQPGKQIAGPGRA